MNNGARDKKDNNAVPTQASKSERHGPDPRTGRNKS